MTYSDPEAGTVLLKKNASSRRMSIRVHPVKGITVIIPESVPYREGLRFFLLKRDWVLKTMRRQRMKIEDAQENGLAVPLLGDGSVVRTLMSEILLRRSTRPESAPLKLETLLLEDVKQTGRTWFSIDRPLFRKTLVYSDSLPSEGSAGLDSLLRNAVAEIMRAEAKLILPGKLDFFASRFGFRYSRVSVKRNSSNWGSCSVRGNINLNLNLVRLPEPLCDCVVLHELCHLKHPDHGPGFHSLLEKLCTDNVARLAMTGDPYLPELAAKINRSRAAMPVHTTMERELKKYRML